MAVSPTPRTPLPPENTQYPFYRRLVGPQSRSGQVRKISPPQGFDHRTVQPVASCYTYSLPGTQTFFVTCDNFFFIIRLNLNTPLFKNKAFPISRGSEAFESQPHLYILFFLSSLCQAGEYCFKLCLIAIRKMFLFCVFINIVRTLRVAGIVSDFRIFIRVCVMRRSQWPRGLRCGSASARLLGLRVRISTGSWLYVSCECCVLSGRGICFGVIICPEESYRMWCV